MESEPVTVGEMSVPGGVRRVSVAVTHSDPPAVVLASDEAVLSRAIALEIVAKADPRRLREQHVDRIREALLDERWSDAVMAWMGATGEVVDAYPDEPVWTAEELGPERTSLELRMAPIFRD
jgi:hypothetical protein